MNFDIDRLHSIAVPATAEQSRRADSRREKRKLRRAASSIALKLDRAMEKRNMSADKLAETLSLPVGEVNRLLSGKENIDLQTMVDLEEALDVTIIDRSVSPWSPWRKEQVAKWKKELEEEGGSFDTGIWISCNFHLSGTFYFTANPSPTAASRIQPDRRLLPQQEYAEKEFDLGSLRNEKGKETIDLSILESKL